MNLIFVIPCYNEERNVKPLIEKIDTVCSKAIHSNSYVIVAVNDGSTDKTGEELAVLKNDFPLIIVKHEHNRGLDQAMKSGFRRAVKIAKPTDLIIRMEGDQTHDPSYLKAMVRNDCDVVVASRHAEGGGQIGVPSLRIALSLGISVLSRLLFNLPTKDVTSGYRCYRARVLERIISTYGEKFITVKGFGDNLELLIKAKRQGAKIVEVPFVLNYSKKTSRSKLKVFKTIVNYLRLLWRLKIEVCPEGR